MVLSRGAIISTAENHAIRGYGGHCGEPRVKADQVDGSTAVPGCLAVLPLPPDIWRRVVYAQHILAPSCYVWLWLLRSMTWFDGTRGLSKVTGYLGAPSEPQYARQ